MSVQLVDVEVYLSAIQRFLYNRVGGVTVLVIFLNLDIAGDAVDCEACNGALWSRFDGVIAQAGNRRGGPSCPQL